MPAAPYLPSGGSSHVAPAQPAVDPREQLELKSSAIRLDEAEELASDCGSSGEPAPTEAERNLRCSVLRAQSVVQTLASNIDAELLRAVPLTEVLSGFGKHLRSITGKAADYSLSQRKEGMDDFLSHDWRTPRFQKTLALCYLYNSRTAVVVSCIFALPLACIGGSRDVSWLRGKLARSICPIIYLVLLVFGQRVRGWFCQPRCVFLDKLCINQSNEERKTAGILGLAGFLRASERLVVLWSPQYFSRLWCTYELVTWCHLHGLDPKRVRFLPVQSGVAMCQALLGLALVEFVRNTWVHLETIGLIERSSGTARTLLIMLLFTPMIYLISLVVRELVNLGPQVQEFSVRASQCFCCTHGHVDPVSGQRMACDRELVYSTLHKWYQEESPSDGAGVAAADRQIESGLGKALDAFDEIVRSGLTRTLTGSSNRALFFCSYWECVSIAMPLMWPGIDFTVMRWWDGHHLLAIRWFVDYLSLVLFVFPLSTAAMVQFCSWRQATGDRLPASWFPTVIDTFVQSLVYQGTFVFLWLPGPLLISTNEMLQALDALLIGRLFGLGLFARRVMRPRGGRQVEVHGAAAKGQGQRFGTLGGTASSPKSEATPDVRGIESKPVHGQQKQPFSDDVTPMRLCQSDGLETTSNCSEKSVVSLASI
eukprot:TRINITY_DN19196_c1_g1_i4.p1 TRINITY_DN19196_c1_g1~~TRINITY_DN19196_c1_g1_i4.p1  ORF type:complete len:653 (+),score=47.80 TRINITY_DN19196_c1_g1_i4:83-2041(+)